MLSVRVTATVPGDDVCKKTAWRLAQESSGEMVAVAVTHLCRGNREACLTELFSIIN